MQGSDFLIKSKSEINQFFCDNKGKEFIEYAPENYEFANWKCRYHHFFVDNVYYRNSVLLKGISHGIVKLERLLNMKNQSIPRLYHGSGLFSITHSCAEYVLRHEMDIHKCYKHAIAADEVFLQTLIMSSPYRENIYHWEKKDGNARYIDWQHREGNSPKTFTISDADTLLNLPKQYCFARKFSDSNIEVAERIMEGLKLR